MKVLAVLLALLLVGCSGSSPTSDPEPTPTADDAAFVRLASHNPKLAREDEATLVTLGHEVCELLDYHGGNAKPVYRFIVKTAGEDGRKFFTPAVLSNLRDAATAVYCPHWS